MMKGHSIQEATEQNNACLFYIRKSLSCAWWDEREQTRKVHSAVIPAFDLITHNFLEVFEGSTSWDNDCARNS